MSGIWGVAAVFAAAVMYGPSQVQAVPLTYTFEGCSYFPTTIPANTTAPFLSFNELNSCSFVDGNPGPAAGGLGSHIGTFTLTPAAGYSLTISGFSFDEQNLLGNGPTAFAVYTSVDGFTTPILSGALGPFAPAFTHHSTSLALSAIDDPVTVRIVATGRDEFPKSVWFLDNITLLAEAVVIAAPVPASPALLALGLAVLGWNRRKR